MNNEVSVRRDWHCLKRVRHLEFIMEPKSNGSNFSISSILSDSLFPKRMISESAQERPLFLSRREIEPQGSAKRVLELIKMIMLISRERGGVWKNRARPRQCVSFQRGAASVEPV